MSRQFATIYDNLWHLLSRPLPPVPFGLRRYQDTFDHNRGQESAISGYALHWSLFLNFLPWIFSPPFSPGVCVEFSDLTLQPLLFFWRKMQGKSRKKRKGFSLRGTPKLLGKGRKFATKRKEARKSKEKKRKEKRRVRVVELCQVLCRAFVQLSELQEGWFHMLCCSCCESDLHDQRLDL